MQGEKNGFAGSREGVLSIALSGSGSPFLGVNG